jgi:hypothetical protein
MDGHQASKISNPTIQTILFYKCTTAAIHSTTTGSIQIDLRSMFTISFIILWELYAVEKLFASYLNGKPLKLSKKLNFL